MENQIQTAVVRSTAFVKKHKAAFMMLGAAAVLADAAMATSTNTEFAATQSKTMDWLKGDAGKTAAVIGTIAGGATAAITKDMMATAKGIGLSLLIPIAISFINGAFSATI